MEKPSPTQTFLCVVALHTPPPPPLLDFPSLDGRLKPFFFIFNHFFNLSAPGDFAEKGVSKLVEWVSGHFPAIKS